MTSQMKKSLKALATASIFTINGACFAEDGKKDIRGFTPGMTFAEAGQVARNSESGCTYFSREVIPYGVKCDGFTLWFSQVIDGAPLMSIYMELRTTAGTPEIVQSLSDQFGKKSVELPPENGFPTEYGWDLGGGKLLRFSPDGKRINYFNSATVQQDQEERLRRSRVPVPKL